MNEQLSLRRYRRDCLIGALGGLLMLVGDLCLSVIPASAGDSGLFLREAYLSGAYEPWRLPLLLVTGLIGMALGFFTVRASYQQIRLQYQKTRLAVLIGGVMYLASAGAIHALIGSLADWTSALGPALGREQASALVMGQYARIMPALLPGYAGMLLLIFGSAFAVLTKKTILPRRMLAFHLIIVELVLLLIPDVRQALGARVSTWDFVLSQGSGNAALAIWMLANAIWAGRQIKREEN